MDVYVWVLSVLPAVVGGGGGGGGGGEKRGLASVDEGQMRCARGLLCTLRSLSVVYTVGVSNNSRTEIWAYRKHTIWSVPSAF